MASRRRRHGGKRKPTADPARTARQRPPDPPARPPLPPARPPRKNLPLLITTAVLMAGWVAFLLYLAVFR